MYGEIFLDECNAMSVAMAAFVTFIDASVVGCRRRRADDRIEEARQTNAV